MTEVSSRPSRQILWSTLCGALVIAIVASAVAPPKPLLIWNRSLSAPAGLYHVMPRQTPATGDMVVARIPETFRALAARRHYLPANVPVVKRVAAVERDVVCASHNEIRINGQWIATRRSFDAAGRALPGWEGCHKLAEGDLFLLMDNAASFDGRYFGVTRRDELIGTARLLWPG